MNPNEEESSLTDRYQTTVPKQVRKALGLSKRDKLEWIIDESGEVRIGKKSPPEPEHVDPVIDQWLGFIEKDILEHPERLIPLDDKWYEDMVSQFSGQPGVGVSGLPPTLKEFLEQPFILDLTEELDEEEKN